LRRSKGSEPKGYECLEKELVIELDGGQRAERTEYDSARMLKLKADGFQVLRFWNNEIFNNIRRCLRNHL
jgi:very-short-patch-repair endonuclease